MAADPTYTGVRHVLHWGHQQLGWLYIYGNRPVLPWGRTRLTVGSLSEQVAQTVSTGANEQASTRLQGNRTKTTRLPSSHYGPDSGLPAESFWVWKHCKRDTVVRGRPVQLMLFVLGCWWRGLGDIMSIIIDPGAFLYQSSHVGLATL